MIRQVRWIGSEIRWAEREKDSGDVVSTRSYTVSLIPVSLDFC